MILLWVLCRTRNLNEFNLSSAPHLNLDYWGIVEEKKKSLWIGNSINSWSLTLTQPLMTFKSPIMCLWAVFIFCEAAVLNCLLCSKRQDPRFSLSLHMTLPPREKQKTSVKTPSTSCHRTYILASSLIPTSSHLDGPEQTFFIYWKMDPIL